MIVTTRSSRGWSGISPTAIPVLVLWQCLIPLTLIPSKPTKRIDTVTTVTKATPVHWARTCHTNEFKSQPLRFCSNFLVQKNNGQIRGLYKDTPCRTPDHHQTTMSSPTKTISDSEKELIKNSAEFKALKKMQGYPRSSDDIIREMAERQRKREKKESSAPDVQVKKQKTESVVSHHKEEARKERKKAITSQETDKKEKKRKKEDSESRKDEDKILRLKYKNNKLFNELEAEKNKNKKLKEENDALKKKMKMDDKIIVRVINRGESDGEYELDYESLHPTFQDGIKELISKGESVVEIDMTEAEAEIYEKLLKIGDRKDDDEYEGYVIGDAMKKLDDATGQNGSEENPEQKHDWKSGISLTIICDNRGW